MSWNLKIIAKITLIIALILCIFYLQVIQKERGNKKFSGDDLNNDVERVLNTMVSGVVENGSEDEDFKDKDLQTRECGRHPSLPPKELESNIEGNKKDPTLFSCPEEFEIDDVNEEWFQTNFKHISPFTEHSEDIKNLQDIEIVIMTPISNVKDKLKHYFKLICSLSHPHDKISIVLGEDSSFDNTFYEAEALARIMRHHFKRVEVHQLLGTRPKLVDTNHHDRGYQLVRRRHLAMSRNQVLARGLRNESWVLWLDSDVRHVPHNLIQHLLSPGKDIVAANCLYRKADGGIDVYDRNTWQETSASVNDLTGKSPDYLMLEGYGDTKRKYLNDLKIDIKSPISEHVRNNFALGRQNSNSSIPHFSDPVKLDGVGGCVLLVKAELHIKGLNFPPFPYHHHIETEGLAKIASEIYGVKIYGLPRVHVLHW